MKQEMRCCLPGMVILVRLSVLHHHFVGDEAELLQYDENRVRSVADDVGDDDYLRKGVISKAITRQYALL